MSDRNDKDLERSAEEALDRLARGWDPMSAEAGAAVGEDEPGVLASLEALSLLAYAVTPLAPPPEIRAGVLRSAAAERRASRPVAAPSLSATTAAGDSEDVSLRLRYVDDPGDMTLVGLGSGASPPSTTQDLLGDDRRQNRDFAEATMRREIPAPPRAANTNLPLYLLAAGLVVCLVGLGYLYGQLQSQNSQFIARQAQLESQADRAREEAESMRARVQMVTDVARYAYPMEQVANAGGALRTVGRPEPGEVRPDGIVYVCGQHQRWYLSLSGFEPAPAGQVYHLWFRTERGVVDAGPIELTEDGRADLSEVSMPEGTRGFLVSLEDAAEADGEPHGQIILKGEQPVKL